MSIVNIYSVQIKMHGLYVSSDIINTCHLSIFVKKNIPKVFWFFLIPKMYLFVPWYVPWGYNERVCYKVVNLAHHDKSEEPTPVE